MLQRFQDEKSRLQEKFEKYFTHNIYFSDEKHYDVFYFEDSDEFKKMEKELTEKEVDNRRSTWYGNLANSVTIVHAPSINKITERKENRLNLVKKKQDATGHAEPLAPLSTKHPIISIVPAQLTTSHIIGVYEDYITALTDLKEYLDDDKNMFDSPANEAFTLFLSVRVTKLEEKIVRRLFLHELIEAVISTTEYLDYNHNPDRPELTYVNIVMYSKDAQQTGLEMLPFKSKTSDDRTNEIVAGFRGFVNIQTSFADLKGFQNSLKCIDSLLIDAVIFANDANFLGAGSNYKLEFTSKRMMKIGSISGNRCIDPKKLKEALKWSDRNGDAEVTKVIEKKMESAIRRLLFMLNAFGVSFDLPVKYIRFKEKFHRSHHLFKLSRNTQGQHLKGMKEMSTFQSYMRRVKAVDKDGFKVQTVNFIYWFMFTVAVAISLTYGSRRRPKASLEDLFQTIVALLTVFITAFTTIILNTTYKGENLGDILTNFRKIDTQTEFEMRTWKQPSDIIEVLRMSHDSPMFLGGGVNTSFIPSLPANAGLQARHPMAFSNLEAVGCGLYETAEGILYMIDQWQNVYRAHIIDNYEESLQYEKYEEMKNNPYVRLSDETSWHFRAESQIAKAPIPTSISNTHLSSHSGIHINIDAASSIGEDTMIPIHEEAVSPASEARSARTSEDKSTQSGEKEKPPLMKLTLYFTFLNQKVDRHFSLDQYTNCNDENSSCCAYVKRYEGESGGPIALSRVLPYQARERPVGVIKRYFQYNVQWLEIENRDLFRMDVGKRLIRIKKRAAGSKQR